jgi:hypothetical protein
MCVCLLILQNISHIKKKPSNLLFCWLLFGASNIARKSGCQIGSLVYIHTCNVNSNGKTNKIQILQIQFFFAGEQRTIFILFITASSKDRKKSFFDFQKAPSWHKKKCINFCVVYLKHKKPEI